MANMNFRHMETTYSVRKVGSMAGQDEYRVRMRDRGSDAWHWVSFVGSEAYGGPVVMIQESGAQIPVTAPNRFGPFGREWVRRFFTD